MNVVILEDAAGDLEAGAQFYESCETGVGDYFPRLNPFRS